MTAAERKRNCLPVPNLTHLKQCVILKLPYPIGGKGEDFSSTLMNTLSGIRYALSDLYAHRTIMFMYLPANLGKLSPVLAGMMHYKGYINAESEKIQSMFKNGSL